MHCNFPSTGLAIVIATGLFFWHAPSASAQTFIWVPPGGGLFNIPTNWTPIGGPPGAGESARFDLPNTFTVTFTSNVTNNEARVSNGAVTFALSGRTYSVNTIGLVVGDLPGQTGRLTITNGTMTGDMSLGSNIGATALFTIGDDALFDALAELTSIGHAGIGTMTVNNAGRYTGTGNVDIGRFDGSNGTLVVTGAGSSFSSGNLTVGNGGIGAATISGGGSANTQVLVVGGAATSKGALTVTGSGSSLNTSGQSLTLGASGAGELTVSGGGAVIALSTTLGSNASAAGSLTVSGAGSSFTSTTAGFTVGSSGAGSLDITGGGVVNSASARIASNAGSTGSALVSGAGSTWNTIDLVVGGALFTNGGTGTLTIADGGTVNVSDDADIRTSAGSSLTLDGGTLATNDFSRHGTFNFNSGMVHVRRNYDHGTSPAPLVIDGATSGDLATLRLSGAFPVNDVTTITVGDNNQGALVLDSGRNVDAGANNVSIGAGALSSGTITLSGNLTRLTTAGTLAVGGSGATAGGSGTLTVGSGAAVPVLNLTLFAGGIINLNGGSITATTFNAQGGIVKFNSGNFTLLEATITDAHLDALLGAGHVLAAGRRISTSSVNRTLASPLVVDGGTLNAPNLNNDSLLRIKDGLLSSGILINNSGRLLQISSAGSLSASSGLTNNGTIELDNNLIATSGGTLTNNGTIRGAGLVANNLTNNAAGQVQLAAGNRIEFQGAANTNNGSIRAATGGTVAFRGTLTNNATLDVIGGTAEFEGAVTNAASTGVINGRDGTLSFRGGLTNNGTMGLSFGTMDVFGDINNSATGRITVSGESRATFFDDVTNNGIVQISAGSTAVFFGAVSGSGSFPGTGKIFFEGDLAPGASPAEVHFGGDLFLGPAAHTVLELGGAQVGGEHDQLDVARLLSLGGTLEVALLDGFAPRYGDSFDLLDFGALSGQFDTIDLPTLDRALNWDTSALYSTGTITAVPEPLAFVLAVVSLACCALYKHSRSSKVRRKKDVLANRPTQQHGKKCSVLICVATWTIVVLAAAPHVLAANRFWINSEGGPFSLTAGTTNWSMTAGGLGGASIPASNDFATFTLGNTYEVAFTANVTNQLLDVRNGNVTLRLSDQFYRLTAPIPAVSIGSTGTGRLTILDGMLDVDTNGDSVFVGSGGPGFLTVTTGGRLGDGTTDPTVYVGFGFESPGTLTINNDGQANINRLTMGQAPGTAGTATVTGPLARMNLTGSTGHSIGSTGAGTLNVTSGGTVTSNSPILLAANSGAQGTISVTGAGSSLTNTSYILVGSDGVGTLSVQSGGAVSSSYATVGDKAGIPGTATISGAGAHWSQSEKLDVGNLGRGTMTVSDGARVTTGTWGNIALQTGSEAGVTVTGAGSRWDIATHLAVGGVGNGTLEVSNGGAVRSNTGTIASNPASTSEATVTGPGSLWSLNDSLIVGFGGAGTLTVADGGAVNVGTTLTIHDAGMPGGPAGALRLRGGSVTARTVDRTGQAVLDLTNGTLRVTSSFNNGGVNFILNGADDDDVPTLHLADAATSLVANLPNLTIGDNRGGAVLVTGGSVLETVSTTIGARDLGRGSLTLSGDLSRLSTSNDLIVGGTNSTGGGAGAVTIGTGSSVVVSRDLVLWPGAMINMDGGRLSFMGLTANGGRANFNAGTVQTLSDMTANDSFLTTFLGSAHELLSGRTLDAGGNSVNLLSSLTVAGGRLQGNALNIGSGAMLRVRSGGTLAFANVMNQSGGTTIIEDATASSGATFTNAGELRVAANTATLTSTDLVNTGLVSGTGRIHSRLVNNATGRVAAGAGQQLVIRGAMHTNAGVVEAIGTSFDLAEIRFEGPLANVAGTGRIGGRNAILRFDGGLANAGSLALSFGTSDLFGDINNTGKVVVSGNSQATFYDDLVNNGTVQVSAGSTAVYFGTVSGAGSFPGTGTNFFEGDLQPGNSPAAIQVEGDLRLGANAGLHLELGGTTAGDHYDQLHVGGQLSLDGSLNVSLLDGFIPSYGATFDLLDFGALAGRFNTIALPALDGALSWDTTSLYTTGTITAVPEPSGWLLALVGLAAPMALRRRRKTPLQTTHASTMTRAAHRARLTRGAGTARSTRWLLAILLVVLIASTSTRAIFAVDYTYSGPDNGNFLSSGNWAPFGVPNDNTDKAIFNQTGTYRVQFIDTFPPFTDLTITNRAIEVQRGTVTLDLYDNPRATTYVLEPAVTGAVVATVGTTAGQSATLSIVGRDFSSDPTFGMVEAQGPLLIGSVAGSTGRVDVGLEAPARVAKWTSTETTIVGSAGTGTLNVSAGSTLTDAGGILGGFFVNTGQGTATIRGAWNNNGSLIVGNFGSGTLNVEANGTVNTDADAVVARSAGETGTVTVTGAGDWTIGGTLAVGGRTSAAGGTGVVNLNGAGATITAGALTVWDPGDVNITNGILTVNGAVTLKIGSRLDLQGGHLKTSPATFTVPTSTFNWTSGTLEFTAPYTVQTGHLLGGSSLTVGANKEFVVKAALGIGTGAAGTLTVNGGGMVGGSSANVGGMASPGTSATVTIAGAGSMWDLATLTVADDVAANLMVDAGGVLSTGNAFASNAAGSNSNIDLTGANTLWVNTVSAYLGGGAMTAGGPGTLDITSGAKMTVAHLLKVWEPYTVTVDNGTIETAHLDALGTINVQGTSTVKATGNVNITSGADVTFSPASTFNAAGATINISGGATLVGTVTGNAMTSATVASAGTTWTMPGSLEIGTASSGQGRIGSLVLQTGSVTNVAGDVTVLDVAKFTIAGGTLNAMSFDAGDQDFSGTGAINARFSTGDDVTATGNLTIGDANSFNGVLIGGNLNVGTHTVTINKKGFFNVGLFTDVSGGTLVAPGGVSLPTGNALAATGAVNARIAAQAGSTIEATGNLALGDATAVDGYFSDGVLLVNERVVTLGDANQAVLGSLTQLGRAGMPGTLVASNGATVELGKNVVGFGTLDTPNNPLKPLVNNGHIGGNSAMEKITLNGYVKGVGTFDNVLFAGTFAPGFSPATINMGGNVEFGPSAALEIEIGGLTPGTQHDRINIAGQATLNGTLELSLINGFVPSPGDSFTIMTFGSRAGTFSQIVQPPMAQFNAVYSASDLVLVATLPTGEKIWAVDANGNTSVGSNWTGGVAPGGVGDAAVFGSVITAPRTVTVDAPITLGRLDFNNANTYTIAGANAITLDVTSGNAQINVVNGSHAISAPVTLADDTVITVAPAASNLSISGTLAASGKNLTKGGAGTLVVNNVRAAGLSVNGGQVIVGANGTASGTSVMNTLALAGTTNAWAARFDLSNNDAVFQSNPANKAADFARLHNQVKQGLNGGDWLGMGVASTAAATNPNADTGLTVVDNALLAYSDFSGQVVTADSILLKYTYYGDIDLNGQVDADDLTVFANNFGKTSATQVDGDIDFNGTVDADDLTVFANNFNKGIGNPLVAGSVKAVPEPATLVLAVLVALLAVMGNCSRALPAEQQTVRFNKKKLMVSPHESCAVADLNKDGNLDIVYGPYWFAGPDFLPHALRPNHTSKDYIRCNSDHVYDIDKDGWLDVIAGAWDENGIIWYKNPGKSAHERGKPWEMHNPWEPTVLTKTRGRMEMFALHDYDRDGVPEIHSACYQKQEPLEIWRLKSNPDGSIALKLFILGPQGGGHGFAFGDVNGDGREDVLCEIGWYERPEGDPFAKPWKLHHETDLSKMHPSCPFLVKDLNKDGRLDIVFGRGHAYGLYWREQLAPKADGTTAWKQHTIDESWSQAHCLAWGDLDGDDADDLIAGKCIWAHNGGDPGAADPPSVYYYTWDPSAAKFTRHTIADRGEMIALGRQFAIADLNGDRRNDLVAPSKIGLWLLLNEGAD